MRPGFLKQHANLFSLGMRLLDLLAIAVAAWLAYFLRFGDWDVPSHYRMAVIAGLAISSVVFATMSLYRPWRGTSLAVELRELLVAWVVVAAACAALAFLTKTGESFSRVWFTSWMLSGVFFLSLGRAMLRTALRMLRRRGFNHRQVVVLGAGRIGSAIVRHLEMAAWTGLEVVAFYDDSPALIGARVEGIPVRGSLDQAAIELREDCPDQVWVALPASAIGRMAQVLDRLQDLSAEVRYVPDLSGFRLLNHSVDEVAGMPVLNLSASPVVGPNALLKAAEDRLLALVFLVITSPLLLVIAVAVRLSSPGPVFHRQQRVTWGGREFQMLKFRTMTVGAKDDPKARQWNDFDASRLTPVGAFLRRYSLDELPQFFNVLRGEMSIVGPRPEEKVFVEQFRDSVPDYMRKHLVKGGMTGWAQVNGWRGESSIEKRIEHDIYYIANWSLWFDVKIMLLTVVRGVRNEDASAAQ
ncbi:MAG: undecaprenyl-phosphate glucose phosphotransferase [Gammaproteobacteria bacterium]|nr:undecaprenyl-phosphate glucose phosphotransferase [Gammaproteobacteria bacterium]